MNYLRNYILAITATLLAGAFFLGVAEASYIPTATTAGNIGIGTNQPVNGKLVVLGGNVGVGSLSPGQALDVQGTVRATTFSGSGSGLTGITAAAGWTDDGTAVRLTTSTDRVGIGSASPNGLLNVVGGGSGTMFRVDDNNAGDSTPFIIAADGNVGVGATPSDSKLQVNGVISSSTNTNVGEYRIGGSTVLSAASVTVLNLNAGGFTNVNLGSSNVGIGSAAPGSTLDVTGTGRFRIANGGNLTLMSSTAGRNDARLRWVKSDGTGLWTFAPDIITATGMQFFHLYDEANAATRLTVSSSGNLGISTVDPNAVLNVSSTAAYNLFRVDDDGTGDTSPFVIASDGNVGVGTTIPAQKVDFNTGLRSTTFTGTSPIGVIIRGDGSGGGYTGLDFNGYYTANSRDLPNARIAVNADGTGSKLMFGTSNSFGSGITNTAMVINNVGNVGIGSIFPASPLTVRGGASGKTYAETGTGITVESNTSPYIQLISPDTLASNLTFASASDSAGAYISWTHNANLMTVATANSGDSIAFLADNNSEKMRIDSSGNVGIATFAPNALLDISSTAAQDLFRVNDNGTGDASPFVIAADGNVGIGSTVPDAKLNVYTAGGANSIRLTADAGQYNELLFERAGILEGVIGLNNLTDDMYFYVNGAEAMRINANSNVGIGSTVPESKLDVYTGGATNRVRLTADAGQYNVLTFERAGILEGEIGLNNSTDDMYFWVNAAERARINADGNLGIGSTAPGTALDVNGVVRSISGGFKFPDGTTQTTAATAGSNYWNLEASNVGINTTTLNVGIGTVTTSAKLHVQQSGTADAFRVDDAAGADTTPFVVLADGNVGVGSINPDEKLSVAGNITFKANSARLKFIPSTTYAIYMDMAFVEQESIVFRKNEGSTDVTEDILSMQRQGGNVGIGTNKGFALLNISSSTAAYDLLRVNDAGTADGTPVIVNSDGNVGIGTVRTDNRLVVIGGNVGFGTYTPQDAFVVTNGNVGIGTWAPAGLLDVRKAAAYADNSFGAITASGAENKILTMGYDATTNYGWINSVHRNSEVRPLILNPQGGSVGIGQGMTSAATKLEVQGAKSAITTPPITVTDTTASGLGVGGGIVFKGLYQAGAYAEGGAVDAYRESSADGDNFALRLFSRKSGVGLTEGLRITSAGNVGIGTTLPLSGLFVKSGNVGISTIHVVPSALLHVQQTAAVDAFRVDDVDAGDGSPFLINAAGNVGIGTVTGIAKLVVADANYAFPAANSSNGIVTVAGLPNTAMVMDMGISTQSGPFSWIQSRNWNDGTKWDLSLNPLGGNVGIGTWMSSGARFSVMGGNVGIGTVTAQAAFVVTNGNVGIGTWTSDKALTVIGGGRISGLASCNTIDTDASGNLSCGTDAGGESGWTLGASNVGISTTNNVGIGTNLTTTAGLTVMSGNVGIGTWVPASLLQVGTGLNLTSSSIYFGSNTGANLTWNGSFVSTDTNFIGATSVGSWGYLGVGTNPDYPDTRFYRDASYVFAQRNGTNAQEMRIYNTDNGADDEFTSIGFINNSNVFTIETEKTGSATVRPIALMGGNVGIGTLAPVTAPTARLHVVQSAAADAFRVDDTDAGDTTPFIILANGNVGIATHTPQFPLTIDGRVHSTGGYSTLIGGSGIGLGVAPSGAYQTVVSAGAIDLQPGAGDNVTITTGTGFTVTSGNVGVGTTTPQTKLSVLGGNVGIGTWTSDKALTVIGGGRISGLASCNTIDTDASGNLSCGTDAGGESGWTLGASNVGISTTNNVGIGTNLTTTAGLTVMSGNVGIGTWVPAGLLTLSTGNGKFTLGSTSAPANNDVAITNTGNGTTFYTNAYSEILTVGWPGGGVNGLSVRSDGSYGWSATTATSGGNFTQDTLFTRLSAGKAGLGTGAAGGFNGTFVTGNIGIGTDMASAAAKLSVIGGNVGIGTNAPQSAFVVTNGNVGIGTWAPAGALIVRQGNVGIGTATPRQTFRSDVFGDAAATRFVAYEPANTYSGPSFVSLVPATGASGVNRLVAGFNGGGGDFAIYAGALNGTGDPINSVNPLLAYFRANSSSGEFGINDTSPDAGIEISQGATVQPYFMASSSANEDGDVMSINSTGNVGIGTITPTAKFQVVGNVGIGTTADKYSLKVNNLISFTSEYDNGTCTGGGSKDIVWSLGNKQKVTLSNGACTITFDTGAPPSGVANYLLRIISGGASSTVTFSDGEATIKFPGGTAPTITASASAIDVISCFYDGTVYYCSASQDFQ